MKKTNQQFGSFYVNSKNFYKSKKFIAVFTFFIVLAAGFYGYKTKHKHASIASVVTSEETIASPIPGWWLHDHFGSSICDQANCQPEADPDQDKLTNAQEFYYNTDPMKKDTNNDGLSDGEDVAQGYDPAKVGKVTFAIAASDDSIFGESLLYQQDVNNIISEMTDLSKVQLPDVPDSELIITQDNTKKGVGTYLATVEAINNKLFPDNELQDIGKNTASDSEIQTMKQNAIIAIETYKKVPVPSDAVQFDKYTIGLLMTLPSILNQPTQSQLDDLTDNSANYWYDQMQVYAALLQKINLQETALHNKYK